MSFSEYVIGGDRQELGGGVTKHGPTAVSGALQTEGLHQKVLPQSLHNCRNSNWVGPECTAQGAVLLSRRTHWNVCAEVNMAATNTLCHLQQGQGSYRSDSADSAVAAGQLHIEAHNVVSMQQQTSMLMMQIMMLEQARSRGHTYSNVRQPCHTATDSNNSLRTRGN